jgi:hypothetical protein
MTRSPNLSLPFRFPTKSEYEFFVSFMRATCPAPFNLLERKLATKQKCETYSYLLIKRLVVLYFVFIQNIKFYLMGTCSPIK